MVQALVSMKRRPDLPGRADELDKYEEKGETRYFGGITQSLEFLDKRPAEADDEDPGEYRIVGE